MAPELRQRRSRNGDHVGASVGSETEASTAAQLSNKKRRKMVAGRLVAVLVHISALVLFVWGFFLRISFHSGQECDMTYSWRHFVPIPTKEKEHSVYRLYKFTDKRDPRQQYLYSTDEVTENWCTANTSTIVLYIPGHWGSYSQSRSVGAHGLQMTRAQHPRSYTNQAARSLQTGKWNGSTTDLASFVYDVYAVDFGEQGGALHSSFLHAQSRFVAHAIMTLVDTCQVDSVIMVAHSMGGLVARSVPLLHPQTQPYLSNLVTLATPHAGLPYGFDETLHEFYRLLKTDEDLLTLVSISGGMRDEMIPPNECHVRDKNALSVLASDITSPRGSLGMDHRAIVWCHDVLSKVREIIHIMAVHDSVEERRARLRELLSPSYDYETAVVKQRDTFRKQFGVWRSLAMESAMLYHMELLLGIYAVTGGLYHAFPNISASLVPSFVTGLALWWSNHEGASFGSLVVLALVANSVHWIVRYGLALAQRRVTSHRDPSWLAFVTWTFITFVCVQVGVALLSYARHSMIAVLAPLPAVFCSFVVIFVVASLQSTTSVTFLSLALPSLPCLVAGKLVMISWTLSSNDEFDKLCLTRFLCSVGLPFLLLLRCKTNGASADSIAQKRFLAVAFLLVLMFFAPRLLRVGGGYSAGILVACLAWVELIVSSWNRYKRYS